VSFKTSLFKGAPISHVPNQRAPPPFFLALPSPNFLSEFFPSDSDSFPNFGFIRSPPHFVFATPPYLFPFLFPSTRFLMQQEAHLFFRLPILVHIGVCSANAFFLPSLAISLPSSPPKAPRNLLNSFPHLMIALFSLTSLPDSWLLFFRRYVDFFLPMYVRLSRFLGLVYLSLTATSLQGPPPSLLRVTPCSRFGVSKFYGANGSFNPFFLHLSIWLSFLCQVLS